MRILALLLILLTFFDLDAQSPRPNFIIIIGDDISWNDLACYGNETVKSPNIDQLASEGIKYTNTYLTASSCSPSRCSIIAGRYPHNTGAAELHTPLPGGMPTMPGELKKSGYYTASAGKWHLGPNAKADFDLVVEKDNGEEERISGYGYFRKGQKTSPSFCGLPPMMHIVYWQPDDRATPHNAENSVVPPYLVDAPGTRQDLAYYYDEIQRLDRFVGEVKAELENQQVLDNTLIIIMADNGRPFPRAKTRVYDSGMKTPFVVSWANGIKSAGQESNSLISVIDIAPTFLELAGLDAGPTFQGISFARTLQDPANEHRQYVFSEHNWHDYEAHERMVRTKHFLYVVNSRPNLPNQGPADSNHSPSYADLKQIRDEGRLSAAQADVFLTPRPHEELFDCLADPEQLSNVASNEKYQETLDDLRSVMRRWVEETGDDVPENLTSSWYDTETGDRLEVEQIRKEMPGTRTKATNINAKGPH
jgi:N-sulfoglucosamine sulfohydrolase